MNNIHTLRNKEKLIRNREQEYACHSSHTCILFRFVDYSLATLIIAAENYSMSFAKDSKSKNYAGNLFVLIMYFSSSFLNSFFLKRKKKPCA